MLYAQVALIELLEKNDVKLSQIFEAIDTSDDNMITEGEFVDGLVGQLGFKGDVQVLHDMFAILDDDQTGTVTFEEANNWARGKQMSKRKRMAAVRTIKLRSDSMPVEGEEPWSIERLRSELRGALKEAGAEVTWTYSRLSRAVARLPHRNAADRLPCPAAALEQVMDLLDSWDDDKDGQIRLREWLVHLKKFVNCKEVEVWYDVVREAVTDAFEEVTICAAH